MGIEQLKAEILEGARKRNEEKLQEAKKEADKIMKEADEAAKKAAKDADAETQKMIEAMRSRETSAAHFDARKALFEKKQEIVQKVFDKVEEQLEGMKDAERADIVKKLLENAKKQADIHYVKGNKKDKATIEKGYAFEEAKMLGGVVGETKERNISIDLSYEQLLQEIRSQKMQEIAKQLF